MSQAKCVKASNRLLMLYKLHLCCVLRLGGLCKHGTLAIHPSYFQNTCSPVQHVWWGLRLGTLIAGCLTYNSVVFLMPLLSPNLSITAPRISKGDRSGKLGAIPGSAFPDQWRRKILLSVVSPCCKLDLRAALAKAYTLLSFLGYIYGAI